MLWLVNEWLGEHTASLMMPATAYLAVVGVWLSVAVVAVRLSSVQLRDGSVALVTSSLSGIWSHFLVLVIRNGSMFPGYSFLHVPIASVELRLLLLRVSERPLSSGVAAEHCLPDKAYIVPIIVPGFLGYRLCSSRSCRVSGRPFLYIPAAKVSAAPPP